MNSWFFFFFFYSYRVVSEWILFLVEGVVLLSSFSYRTNLLWLIVTFCDNAENAKVWSSRKNLSQSGIRASLFQQPWQVSVLKSCYDWLIFKYIHSSLSVLWCWNRWLCVKSIVNQSHLSSSWWFELILCDVCNLIVVVFVCFNCQFA